MLIPILLPFVLDQNSPMYSRSSQGRAAVAAVAIAFVAVTALCLPFLISGTDIPTTVVLVGRWIPALASLISILLILDRGQLVQLWKLRPTSLRELGASYGVALLVMLPLLAVPALMGLLVGGELQPWGVLLQAVPMIVALTVLLGLSTLGEEVLWRGHLQTVLRPLGFWKMSVIVAAIWMLWHLPLHLTYLLQGTLSGGEVLAGTLGVAAWAPLLAALVERRGTIWPAVFAHAVPLSSMQLLTPASADSPMTFWVVNCASWLFMLTAAVRLRHRPLPALS